MLAGGLSALQNTVIVTSAPFLLIIAGLTVSFWRELVLDRRPRRLVWRSAGATCGRGAARRSRAATS